MSGAPRQVALFTHEEPRDTGEAIAAAATAAAKAGCELVLGEGELAQPPADVPGLTIAPSPPERPDL